jgi:hypothetical protein
MCPFKTASDTVLPEMGGWQSGKNNNVERKQIGTAFQEVTIGIERMILAFKLP